MTTSSLGGCERPRRPFFKDLFSWYGAKDKALGLLKEMMERKDTQRPFSLHKEGDVVTIVGKHLYYEGSAQLADYIAGIRIAYAEWTLEDGRRNLGGARVTYWPGVEQWLREEKVRGNLRGKQHFVIPPRLGEEAYKVTLEVGRLESYGEILEMLQPIAVEGRVIEKRCLICGRKDPKAMTRHHITPKFAFNQLERAGNGYGAVTLQKAEALTLAPLCKDCHNHYSPYSLEGLLHLLEEAYGGFNTLDSFILLLNLVKLENSLFQLGKEMVEMLRREGKVNIKSSIRAHHIHKKLCREDLYSTFLARMRAKMDNSLYI